MAILFNYDYLLEAKSSFRLRSFNRSLRMNLIAFFFVVIIIWSAVSAATAGEVGRS